MLRRGVALAVLMAASEAGLAATFSLHPNLASFEAAIGGPAPLTQDFEGYAAGTNLNAVPFLPGAVATSNFPQLEVFQGAGDKDLFGFGGNIRSSGLGTYIFDFTNNYPAVAFDVDAWNPQAPGPATMQVLFSDGTNEAFHLFQTGPTEDTPVFVGITSSNAYIRQIIWREGPEIGGSGNEEVAFDNFRLSPTVVPIPPAVWLFGSGLLGLIGIARRRLR